MSKTPFVENLQWSVSLKKKIGTAENSEGVVTADRYGVRELERFLRDFKAFDPKDMLLAGISMMPTPVDFASDDSQLDTFPEDASPSVRFEEFFIHHPACCYSRVWVKSKDDGCLRPHYLHLEAIALDSDQLSFAWTREETSPGAKISLSHKSGGAYISAKVDNVDHLLEGRITTDDRILFISKRDQSFDMTMKLTEVKKREGNTWAEEDELKVIDKLPRLHSHDVGVETHFTLSIPAVPK